MFKKGRERKKEREEALFHLNLRCRLSVLTHLLLSFLPFDSASSLSRSLSLRVTGNQCTGTTGNNRVSHSRFSFPSIREIGERSYEEGTCNLRWVSEFFFSFFSLRSTAITSFRSQRIKISLPSFFPSPLPNTNRFISNISHLHFFPLSHRWIHFPRRKGKCTNICPFAIKTLIPFWKWETEWKRHDNDSFFWLHF